jgi:Right handed beta helix region
MAGSRTRLKAFLTACITGLALAGCCTLGRPLALQPNPQGAQAQRDLITRSFSGTDLRSDPAALAAFRAGLRDSISVAWLGQDENDATGSLQACLDSGARVVLIPAMDHPWMTQPLFVRSHTTIVIQENAMILAKKGSFRGSADSLFSLHDVVDVTFSGYGARLMMRKSDYRRKPYEESQWRHGIEMYGCTDISILGLTVESSGGDGVYLGGSKQSFDKNVTLRDLSLRDNYRQGISVISAEDLLIENVEMSGTEGTLPSAGIDFEPNYSEERIIRCVLQSCVIRSNAGPGILVNLKSFKKDSRPVDISIRDCVVSRSLFALMLVGARAARGTLELHRTGMCGLQMVGLGSGVDVVRD